MLFVCNLFEKLPRRVLCQRLQLQEEVVVSHLTPANHLAYAASTRERRMVQPMKIDSNSCKTLREVTEA
jgi:hypothetical protein